MEKNQQYKNCQSCGMPLKKDPNKEHEFYCSYCWKNNEFTDPNITLEGMKKINFEVMTTKLHFPKFMANYYNKKLDNLERWKNQNNSKIDEKSDSDNKENADN